MKYSPQLLLSCWMSVLGASGISFSVSASAFEPVSARALFEVPFTSSQGPVGIYYWFENSRGERFTSFAAAQAAGEIKLLVRSNTSGWISLWQEGGGKLTPDSSPPYGGYSLREKERYAVPVDIRKLLVTGSARLFIVFGRSQTEQVASSEGALEKILGIQVRNARDGSSELISEAGVGNGDDAGTWVVNRIGMPVGAIVSISPLQKQGARAPAPLQ